MSSKMTRHGTEGVLPRMCGDPLDEWQRSLQCEKMVIMFWGCECTGS